jgi:hypothetical protein
MGRAEEFKFPEGKIHYSQTPLLPEAVMASPSLIERHGE